MADFEVELLAGDFVAAVASTTWTDPAVAEDPTRLNPLGHVQHRHTRVDVAFGSTVTVQLQAIVGGVHAPADAALGGRLFTWSMGIWAPGAPIPMIVSPYGGKTSVARTSISWSHPGHYVIVAARPSGGHVGYPFDVRALPAP